MAFCLNSQAQFNPRATYEPLSQSDDLSSEFYAHIRAKVNKRDYEIPQDKYRNDVQRQIKNRGRYVVMMYNNGYFLFNEDLQKHVNDVLQEIIEANDLDARKIRVAVSKDPSPNASSIGDGTLIINLGLLRRLSSDAQLAFILAHEIAHYKLDHGNQAIRQKVIERHKERREGRSNVERTDEYLEESVKAFRKHVYNDRKHSRFKELDADSLGVIYLKNAGYEIGGATATLALLDTVDHPKLGMDVDLIDYFNESVLRLLEEEEEEVESLFDSDADNDDFDLDEEEIRTHPECEKRIKRINARFGEGQAMEEDDLSDLALRLDFEYIAGLDQLGLSATAIAEIMRLRTLYPNNEYLTKSLVRNWYLLTKGRYDYRLGNALDRDLQLQDSLRTAIIKIASDARKKQMAEIGLELCDMVAGKHDLPFLRHKLFFAEKTGDIVLIEELERDIELESNKNK